MPIEKNLKNRNMVKFFIVMAMLLGSSVASAENKQITSPDGKLVVTVADMDGRPSYSVSYDNVLFLKPSPLGMIANIGDFSSGMSLEKNVSTNKIDETYELASIKQSKVRYVANEAVFSFTQQGKTIYDVIFRISNNDVAFKYRMYPQGETLSCVIKKEHREPCQRQAPAGLRTGGCRLHGLSAPERLRRAGLLPSGASRRHRGRSDAGAISLAAR